MSDERKCACKGIRTCLLCEQQSDVSVDRYKSKEVTYVYTYCPQCNLCWPDNEETACQYDFPLYLGTLKLCLDFFTEDEETVAITSIDKIPWMPSQSGRRKQDFGPKINFKKKKVKIGEFKGFPRFTESILHKLQDVPELSDFRPVELCHLEYSPERGSSIDPHVDDFWLWGERLVTINLGSSTVLTLIPCSEADCKCDHNANPDSCQPCTSFNGHADMTHFQCNHKFQGIYSLERSLWSMSTDDATSVKNRNTYSDDLEQDPKNSKLFHIGVKDSSFSSTQILKNNSAGDIQRSVDQLKHRSLDYKMPLGDNENSSSSGSKLSCKNPDSELKSVKNSRDICDQNNSNAVYLKTSPRTRVCDFRPTDCKRNIKTMCSIFRTGVGDFKAAIRIVLPPRSLLVLAGCARYNWCHEIKRQDVVSRRVAMTFRELTAEFLDGGTESQLGKHLMQIANKLL